MWSRQEVSWVATSTLDGQLCLELLQLMHRTNETMKLKPPLREDNERLRIREHPVSGRAWFCQLVIRLSQPADGTHLSRPRCCILGYSAACSTHCLIIQLHLRATEATEDLQDQSAKSALDRSPRHNRDTHFATTSAIATVNHISPQSR